MRKQTLASIDLGTNSCRLKVVSPTGAVLYKNAVSTRLGEGMSKANRFTDEAVKRGVDCFCSFKEIMDQHKVTNYRAIATAACRMAENGPAFVEKVKQDAGINLEVISGYEEAVLNLKGAMLNLKKDKSDYVVVYDLGGGSTEITLATHSRNPEILYTVSIPWGARNSTEKFDLEEYKPEQAKRLAEEISHYSKEFVEKSGLEQYRDNVCFIATSSTPLRLAHFVNGWKKYNRNRADGLVVTTADLDKEISKIQQMSFKEMSANGNIGPDRAEIFQAACVIFSQIYRDLAADKIVVSLKSAVDGIIMDLQQQETQENRRHKRYYPRKPKGTKNV